MTLKQFTRENGQVARTYEYDDETVVAVDFGATETDTAVDLLDDTVIVVVDGEQYEFELPVDADDAHTFMKNGVLTIEMEDNE